MLVLCELLWKSWGPLVQQGEFAAVQTNVFLPWLNDSLTLSRSHCRGGCLLWPIWWGVPWMLPWKAFWKKSFPAPAAGGFSCCSDHLLCCSWAARSECWGMENVPLCLNSHCYSKQGRKSLEKNNTELSLASQSTQEAPKPSTKIIRGTGKQYFIPSHYCSAPKERYIGIFFLYVWHKMVTGDNWIMNEDTKLIFHILFW